ncbi:hypothetical protein SDC9_180544 [bioreactor metagenome]|uniref:Uncharacterized protein n=1 Tax=bioreactor metagenome TaxID=1076179 RepID=A0A645H218_9ZZZZ
MAPRSHSAGRRSSPPPARRQTIAPAPRPSAAPVRGARPRDGIHSMGRSRDRREYVFRSARNGAPVSLPTRRAPPVGIHSVVAPSRVAVLLPPGHPENSRNTGRWTKTAVCVFRSGRRCRCAPAVLPAPAAGRGVFPPLPPPVRRTWALPVQRVLPLRRQTGSGSRGRSRSGCRRAFRVPVSFHSPDTQSFRRGSPLPSARRPSAPV